MKNETSVLRVRFHGRGGQGMKTASRILGSAAFRAGFTVQDSPSYGAERRGAPMVALTRMARGPILERGAIERPHLVVVADDTLLDEPASAPLAGCDDATTLLVNSVQQLSLAHRTMSADFTTMAFESTGRLSGLSTVLGAAASSLVGLSEEDCVAGVAQELKGALGAAEELERNTALAHDVYGRASMWSKVPWPERERASEVREAEAVALSLDDPRRAAPNIYASANSPARRTGAWRQFRPVLEPERCNRCWLCFVWCPEAAIALDAEEYPRVDYDVCKGCLLCAHECPTHAFRVEREVRG